MPVDSRFRATFLVLRRSLISVVRAEVAQQHDGEQTDVCIIRIDALEEPRASSGFRCFNRSSDMDLYPVAPPQLVKPVFNVPSVRPPTS